MAAATPANMLVSESGKYVGFEERAKLQKESNERKDVIKKSLGQYFDDYSSRNDEGQQRQKQQNSDEEKTKDESLMTPSLEYPDGMTPEEAYYAQMNAEASPRQKNRKQSLSRKKKKKKNKNRISSLSKWSSPLGLCPEGETSSSPSPLQMKKRGDVENDEGQQQQQQQTEYYHDYEEAEPTTNEAFSYEEPTASQQRRKHTSTTTQNTEVTCSTFISALTEETYDYDQEVSERSPVSWNGYIGDEYEADLKDNDDCGGSNEQQQQQPIHGEHQQHEYDSDEEDESYIDDDDESFVQCVEGVIDTEDELEEEEDYDEGESTDEFVECIEGVINTEDEEGISTDDQELDEEGDDYDLKRTNLITSATTSYLPHREDEDGHEEGEEEDYYHDDEEGALGEEEAAIIAELFPNSPLLAQHRKQQQYQPTKTKSIDTLISTCSSIHSILEEDDENSVDNGGDGDDDHNDDDDISYYDDDHYIEYEGDLDQNPKPAPTRYRKQKPFRNDSTRSSTNTRLSTCSTIMTTADDDFLRFENLQDDAIDEDDEEDFQDHKIVDEVEIEREIALMEDRFKQQAPPDSPLRSPSQYRPGKRRSLKNDSPPQQPKSRVTTEVSPKRRHRREQQQPRQRRTSGKRNSLKQENKIEEQDTMSVEPTSSTTHTGASIASSLWSEYLDDGVEGATDEENKVIGISSNADSGASQNEDVVAPAAADLSSSQGEVSEVPTVPSTASVPSSSTRTTPPLPPKASRPRQRQGTRLLSTSSSSSKNKLARPMASNSPLRKAKKANPFRRESTRELLHTCVTSPAPNNNLSSTNHSKASEASWQSYAVQEEDEDTSSSEDETENDDLAFRQGTNEKVFLASSFSSSNPRSVSGRSTRTKSTLVTDARSLRKNMSKRRQAIFGSIYEKLTTDDVRGIRNSIYKKALQQQRQDGQQEDGQLCQPSNDIDRSGGDNTMNSIREEESGYMTPGEEDSGYETPPTIEEEEENDKISEYLVHFLGHIKEQALTEFFATKSVPASSGSCSSSITEESDNNAYVLSCASTGNPLLQYISKHHEAQLLRITVESPVPQDEKSQKGDDDEGEDRETRRYLQIFLTKITEEALDEYLLNN